MPTLPDDDSSRSTGSTQPRLPSKNPVGLKYAVAICAVASSAIACGSLFVVETARAVSAVAPALTGQPIRETKLPLAATPALGVEQYVPRNGVSTAASTRAAHVRSPYTVVAQATPLEPGVPSAASCTGVNIVPGYTDETIQQLIDDHPDGTAFCFSSGTYVLTRYLRLKQDTQFICTVRRTCIITGLDQYRGGLTAYHNTSHQIIRGFVIERFASSSDVWPHAGIQLRDHGTIVDNETRYNETGITVGPNQIIRGNSIHHNRRYGIAGGPADNVLIEDNELAFNNTAHHDPNDDAGGSKIVGSRRGSDGITWRRNHVHDNYGQGIWSDGNVRNVLYEQNTVENNAGAGIDHEISWNAVIRNNKLSNNNTLVKGQGKSCWHGAQIAVNNSQNISIYANQVEAVDTNAICVVNSTRNEEAPFPQALANIYVYGNLIRMRGDVYTGATGNEAPLNVVFFGNVYYVDNLASSKWVFLRPMTRAQWQAEKREVGAWFATW